MGGRLPFIYATAIGFNNQNNLQKPVAAAYGRMKDKNTFCNLACAYELDDLPTTSISNPTQTIPVCVADYRKYP
jgi:hypothetical protein